MSIKKDKGQRAFFGTLWEGWDEILKSHKYSRKELVNGVWRYYYDKNNNYSRMTHCKAKPLAVSETMTTKQIVDIAHDYLKNVWIADWKRHPERAIVKELHGKQVEFSNISYNHIKTAGKNSSKGGGKRDKANLLNHVKYLPLAKELLEENGVHTQSRYEKIKKKTKDGHIALVYQTISGLAPAGDTNDYVHVTVSQKKYADGRLGNTIYISVLGAKNIKKSIPSDSSLTLNMLDITEGNRQAKYDELRKCLIDGEAPRYVADDGTKRLGRAEITLKDLSQERINKALRTMAFTLDVPLKAGKGEAFSFKAQEDLADKWAHVFASLVRDTYDFITNYLSLPQVTVMSKAYLTHKGKILYSPETGEPIKQAEWNKFVKNLEAFLNRRTADLGKRIVLEGEALGRILDRMLKYNTLDAVKKTRLEGLKFHGKGFDWIAEDIKNLKNALGEPLTRTQAARIQVMQMSAAQRITKMTVEMKESAKQILIDGARNRQGASQVSQALFERFVGLNSNYQRIAETELQNAANGAIVHEETAKAKEGEKVYFQRVEIIDDNTCEYCKRMNGKIAVWSDVPLANERIKDEYAEFAIWEGKEWVSGQKNIAAVGCFHPYCRGLWTRWKPEGKAADAYTAEISRRGKKWKEAVAAAREEYRGKGIENPDDRTAGFVERIEELFAGEIQKSFVEGEHPRDSAGRFTKKGEEAKGSGEKPKGNQQKEKTGKKLPLKRLFKHIRDNVMTKEEIAEVERIIARKDWETRKSPNGHTISVAPSRQRMENKDAFKQELEHAFVFADRGYKVYLPKEEHTIEGQRSYDAIVDGVKVEFKYITGKARNVGGRYKDGLKQSDNVSFLISNKAPSKKIDYISELKYIAKDPKKNANALIVYFQADGSIESFYFSETEETKDIKKSALERTLFALSRAESANAGFPALTNKADSIAPLCRASDNQTIRTERLPANKNSLICKAYIVNKNLNIYDEFWVDVGEIQPAKEDGAIKALSPAKDSAMSKICFVNKTPDIYSDLVARAEAIRAMTSCAVEHTAQDLLQAMREIDGEEEPTGFFEQRR